MEIVAAALSSGASKKWMMSYLPTVQKVSLMSTPCFLARSANSLARFRVSLYVFQPIMGEGNQRNKLGHHKPPYG
jgi:hypothetical protein